MENITCDGFAHMNEEPLDRIADDHDAKGMFEYPMRIAALALFRKLPQSIRRFTFHD
jgi:hypothetical protein